MFNQELTNKINTLIDLSNKKDNQNKRLKDLSFNLQLDDIFDNIFTKHGLKKVDTGKYSTLKENHNYQPINLDVEVDKSINDLETEIFLEIQININIGEFNKKIKIWISSEGYKYFFQYKDTKEEINLNTLEEELTKKILAKLE